jgi:hypothetical protein
VLLKRGTSYWDVADLDLYYRDCVIGGQGAFMIPVREREQFSAAVRTKIILEIAGLTPPEPLLKTRAADVGLPRRRDVARTLGNELPTAISTSASSMALPPRRRVDGHGLFGCERGR